MAKDQFHVSLRDPMRVKLNDVSILVAAFDAEILQSSMCQPDEMAFAAHTLYLPRDFPNVNGVASKRFTGTLIVPMINIAGRAVQAFRMDGR